MSTDALLDALSALGPQADLQVTTELFVAPDCLEVPGRVADAVTRATGEALRNVRRHAGLGRADLTVWLDAAELMVVVRDRGVGMRDPTVRGTGMTESIYGAMRQVDGKAAVSSSRDGTRVALVWAPPDTSPTAPVRPDRLPSQVGYLMLVANACLALHTLPTQKRPAFAVATAVVSALAVVRVVRLLEARTPTGPVIALWTTVACIVTGVGLYAAGPGALTDTRSWVVGFAELPLAMLAFYTPARALPALTVPPLLVVVAAAALDRSAAASQAFGAFNAAVTPAVGAALLGALIRRAQVRVQQARRRSMQTHLELARRVHYDEAKDTHLSHTLRAIVPWLAAVVDHPDRRHDAQVREQASAFAIDARDDLNTSGFMTQELRAAVHAHRRAGGEVSFGVGLPRSPLAEHAVRRLLALAEPGATITLGLAREGLPELVRLSVTPGVPDPRKSLGLPVEAILECRSDVYGSSVTFRVCPIGDGGAVRSARP